MSLAEKPFTNFPGFLRHVRAETAQVGLSRDAIELWAKEAAAAVDEYSWDARGKVEALEEAIALYLPDESTGQMSDKPITLAWHDQSTVIIGLGPQDTEIEISYTPGLRDENRAERLQHRYGTEGQRFETILDWRGYFGNESAVVDGFKKMRSSGRGFVVSLRGTLGVILGSVLRRRTRSQPTPARDSSARERLVSMSERYEHVVANCPNLEVIAPVEADRATVFVHGTKSCGIQGLKDVYPAAGPMPNHPTYRYEHDTFVSVLENGAELAELINSKVRAKHLLLAAHSRGGLVARVARVNLATQGYPGEVHLYTFGTPHLGTPLVRMGETVLNLIYKLGEDVVGGLPVIGPVAKAASYLHDSPDLPPGIAVMAEGSEVIDTLRFAETADRVRVWGANYDMMSAQAGFGVEVEGVLIGAMGKREHDLVVPLSSALGFGSPEPALRCSHVNYFTEATVKAAMIGFGAQAPAGVAPAATIQPVGPLSVPPTQTSTITSGTSVQVADDGASVAKERIAALQAKAKESKRITVKKA